MKIPGLFRRSRVKETAHTLYIIVVEQAGIKDSSTAVGVIAEINTQVEAATDRRNQNRNRHQHSRQQQP